MPLLKRKCVLAAKIETTSGTAETVTATDAAFNAYNAIMQPSIAMTQREGQGGFGWLSSVPEGHQGAASFRTYLEWDGTATEPSWADTFFPACGWVKSSQTYSPLTEAPGSSVKTLTIAHYQNGIRKLLYGCMGTFVVTLPTGKAGYIDWTFTGKWGGVTDATILAPTYPTDRALRYAGGLAEWNDINLCVESAVIDAGNEVILRECPTSETGYAAALVTNRQPKIKVNPEATTVAAQDRWGLWLSRTEYALELDVSGATDELLSFDAAKAQIMNNQEGDRRGMITDEIEFQCNKNGANLDQELQITFTAAS